MARAVIMPMKPRWTAWKKYGPGAPVKILQQPWEVSRLDANPNGSVRNIAGICNETKKCIWNDATPRKGLFNSPIGKYRWPESV